MRAPLAAVLLSALALSALPHHDVHKATLATEGAQPDKQEG